MYGDERDSWGIIFSRKEMVMEVGEIIALWYGMRAELIRRNCASRHLQ